MPNTERFQVLAMGAANMVVMNLTIALSLSTLVIAELHRPNAELAMDDTMASWFGSLPFFCQPIGSLSSGFLVQWLGRRKSLMIINIPYTIGCLLICTAPSITVLFLANILLGTTIGFSEAPINNYFGEICQPELRSTLAGSAAIFYQVGIFTLFVLGSLTSWRSTAGIVAIIPAVTMLMLSRVPESPIWLVAQGRHKDAEAALCWLRGWVDRSAVQVEFRELVKYYDNITNKLARNVLKFVEIFKLLLEPETLRPLFLTVSFFVLYAFGGYPSIRPFLVEVIESFHSPLKGTWSTVVMATTGFVGSVMLVASIHRLGKRSVSLASTGICAGSFLLLGLYAYLCITPSTPTGADTFLIPTWVPLVLFAVLSFANTIQGQMPWLLITEVFPYRTRGVAGGMAAGSVYFVCFIAAKTFLSTEHSMQLYGSFWLFGAINCFCFAFLYFLLPETEGKSLEEIESLFAGNKGRAK
ncbi:hypothetical protein Cfor_10876 [Coptotermes formosanus]|uniref:Major facilitator superfamily (MFS) profile domain-containing protein n=1 Tax=Coptotermes formosanus TaxID=36987 RepID=A0A6L2PEA1_COPFO|nr:hypothetical protein Cfor_10876 [Coptotermes formosanus]